jgi:5-methylcytosine-specific restriction endonuclease McrA
MSKYTTSLNCVICGNKVHARNMCRSHYRKVIGENKRRWLKVKNDERLSQVLKESVKRYRQTDAYRESKKKSDRKYYEKNKDELLEYRSRLREHERFGVSRETILKRDGYKCNNCKSEEDLVIHHINGKGRSVDIPDNDLRNLVTLCRSCHMKIHLFDK